MLKHLLRIIWNERMSNAALWVELILVALAFWCFTDQLLAYYRVYARPMGCDIEHVYQVKFSLVPRESPDYDPQWQDTGVMLEHFEEALRRLEAHPTIEATCASHNAFPHQGSNSSLNLGRDSVAINGVLLRRVTPGFFDVFRVRPCGEKEPPLREGFEHTAIINEVVARQLGFDPPESARGQEILSLGRDTAVAIRVSAVNRTMYVDNFWTWDTHAFYPMRLADFFYAVGTPMYMEVGIRVRQAEDFDYPQRFMAEVAPQLRLGNMYVSACVRLTETKEAFQRDNMNGLKRVVWLALFMVACIMLGIVGSFWYRTQQRREQIGVRMALGDTPNRLLWMYISEGLLLLYLTLPFTVGGFYAARHFALLDYARTVVQWRLVLGVGGAYALMSLFIMVGVWIPTRRAVRISPSEAIRAE